MLFRKKKEETSFEEKMEMSNKHTSRIIKESLEFSHFYERMDSFLKYIKDEDEKKAFKELMSSFYSAITYYVCRKNFYHKDEI